MDGRTIVTVINASFILGWLNNTVGGLADPSIAFVLRVVLSASCLMMFVLTVDMKELFSGHDFHEVLAIYFVPFILAAVLPWAISTSLVPILLLGGAIIIMLTKRTIE